MEHRSLTRRDFLKTAGLFGVGTALAACVAAPNAPAPSARFGFRRQPTGAAAAGLRALWVSQTALVDYFKKFNEEVFGPAHDGVKVEFEISPKEEFPQKILAGIAAGAPPDLFRVVNVENFDQFAASGVILSLDDLIARDDYQSTLDKFLPGSLNAFSLEGKQYCAPLGAHPSSQYLFYNKTALGVKGIELNDPKWTWAEYRDVANKMADPDNQVFGSWVRANFEGYMVGLRSMGGDLISEDGTKSMIASEEAMRFWQLVYDLINVDKVTPQPSDVADWKPPFADGKIMMANDNGYRESFLHEMVKDFDFDTFLVPNEGDKPRGGLIADASAIVAKSSQTDLAWEWVKATLTTEQGIAHVQARYIPLPTQEALLAPEVMSSPQYEFYVKQWIAEPPLPAPTAANGRTSEVYNALQSGMEAAWLQTQPLEAVIEQVDKELQSILDKQRA